MKALLVETAVQSPLVVPDANGHDPYFGYGNLSATGVMDQLVEPEKTVEEKDEAAACGCAQADGGWGWGAVGALAFMLGRRAAPGMQRAAEGRSDRREDGSRRRTPPAAR